jgi:hypothetical protein
VKGELTSTFAASHLFSSKRQALLPLSPLSFFFVFLSRIFGAACANLHPLSLEHAYHGGTLCAIVT